MKQALSQIDEKKQGVVKRETFFQILQVLDCGISLKEKNLLCKKFEKNGSIEYLEAIRFLVINPENYEWEFKLNWAHRRLMTLDTDTDNRSLNASSLNDVWNKHIATIGFDDYSQKASSVVRKSQINKNNLRTLSQRSEIMSQGRVKSRKSRMQTAISRNQDFVRSSMPDNSLLKFVLSKFKDNKANYQLLNGIRYECYRFDQQKKDYMYG